MTWVATFLATVEAGCDPEDADLVAEYGCPDQAEIASVLGLAVRLRFGGVEGPPRALARGGAARRVALLVLLVNGVFVLMSLGVELWLTGALGILPAPPPVPHAPTEEQPAWAAVVLVWPAAFLALVFGRPGTAAVLAAIGLGHTAIMCATEESLEVALTAGLSTVVSAGYSPRSPHFTATHHRCPGGPGSPRSWPGSSSARRCRSSSSRSNPARPLSRSAWTLWSAAWPPWCAWPAAPRAAPRGPEWPLALTVIGLAALIPRMASLAATLPNLTPAERAWAAPIGIAQVVVVLALTATLATISARDLHQLSPHRPAASDGQAST